MLIDKFFIQFSKNNPQNANKQGCKLMKYKVIQNQYVISWIGRADKM